MGAYQSPESTPSRPGLGYVAPQPGVEAFHEKLTYSSGHPVSPPAWYLDRNYSVVSEVSASDDLRNEDMRRKRAVRMRETKEPKVIPAKGKAKVKITQDGRKVSYGQAGEASIGGPRVKPGTAKGDSYCARSAGQMEKHPEAAADPDSPLRLSRKRWKCSGAKSKSTK